MKQIVNQNKFTRESIGMDRLREYQLRLLSMLKQFDSFAKKNEIPYFLLGGNALAQCVIRDLFRGMMM